MEGSGGSPHLGREGASKARAHLEGLQGETIPDSSNCTSQEKSNQRREPVSKRRSMIKIHSLHRILKMED